MFLLILCTETIATSKAIYFGLFMGLGPLISHKIENFVTISFCIFFLFEVFDLTEVSQPYNYYQLWCQASFRKVSFSPA